ncbi:penicillin-insensitive murein endopeptidase [Aquamicrobium segne]|uniref:Penicillin-insensitive murein endopeptidase n=1 Tax=Aquamicrobium segne TaxID=469547 RepID=A0ABW0H1R9_9HYPH
MRKIWAKIVKGAAALAALTLLMTISPQTVKAQELAKNLFGSHQLPAATPPQSIGFYSKGCFSGGVAIATDGPTWQAMRLSRNRRWGHPTMISLIEKFSRDAVADGWPGLLLGDISQPRGGPMLTGHASHQIGLDADIWFMPMPNRKLTIQERENISAVSLIDPKTRKVIEKRWTPAHAQLLKRAASYGEVERVLVHPGIKKKLCDTVTGDRAWLRKIRPFWGHDYHFHIRIGCQPGSPDCKRQEKVAAGEGCDKSLAWWFTEEPWRPNPNPDAPKARDVMTMAALPNACRAVLAAPDPVSLASVTYPSGAQANIARADPIAALVASGGLPTGANAFAPTPEIGAPLPFSRPVH